MSGINIVVGPPGAGKGLWLIQVVRDILLDTELTIVTNFAVKLPELNAWLQKNHPEKAVDLHERIRFLELDEIKRFYLIRGPGREIAAVTKEQEKQNVFPDYDPSKQWPAVCYILDEADIHFGAREYAEHGRSVNFYNKQHRKLSDSVYYCCQSAEQLDKQIRLLAQQTIILKNLGKQKKGIFSLPQLFCWFICRTGKYSLPTIRNLSLRPSEWRLSAGKSSCSRLQRHLGRTPLTRSATSSKDDRLEHLFVRRLAKLDRSNDDKPHQDQYSANPLYVRIFRTVARACSISRS